MYNPTNIIWLNWLHWIQNQFYSLSYCTYILLDINSLGTRPRLEIGGGLFLSMLSYGLTIEQLLVSLY